MSIKLTVLALQGEHMKSFNKAVSLYARITDKDGKRRYERINNRHPQIGEGMGGVCERSDFEQQRLGLATPFHHGSQLISAVLLRAPRAHRLD
jgi:hypothetical protein